MNKIIPLTILFSLQFFFYACESEKNPTIIMETFLGTITAELFPRQAPTTVKNFLSYVEQNRYDECHFYRVVHSNNQPENKILIEVIQGGLGIDKHPLELKAITHENTDQTNILHKNGTISMARLEPGSASSEIFICINDQPELDHDGNRNPDGKGFAAFGKVISGMEVVRAIHSLPNENQLIKNVVKVNSFKIRWPKANNLEKYLE